MANPARQGMARDCRWAKVPPSPVGTIAKVLVARAWWGSRPTRSSKGEKTSPPPMPRTPESKPVRSPRGTSDSKLHVIAAIWGNG